MADERAATGREPERVDVKDEAGCRYWSKRFGVRPKELKAAVRAMGENVEDVTRYVGELKQSQGLTS